jgi:hypothetical protein
MPTREEAQQVLAVSVARQQEITGQCISLTKQRREVLCHPERLESLGMTQGSPHVELLPRPKKRTNCQEIINISNTYADPYGPQLASLDESLLTRQLCFGWQEAKLHLAIPIDCLANKEVKSSSARCPRWRHL